MNFENWKTSALGFVVAVAGGVATVFPNTLAGQVAQVIVIAAGALGLHLAADAKKTL